MASTATLALNSGEWFLRGLLLMVFLLFQASGPGCCRRVSTYRSVQISGATSLAAVRSQARSPIGGWITVGQERASPRGRFLFLRQLKALTLECSGSLLTQVPSFDRIFNWHLIRNFLDILDFPCFPAYTVRMTQALANTVNRHSQTADRPRVEAAELSEALGIKDFSYWETRTPTFRGVYKGSLVTFEKRARIHEERARRTAKRSEWQSILKRHSRRLEEGFRLPLDWVVTIVSQMDDQDRSPAQDDSKFGNPEPTALARITLDAAAQGQSESLIVDEPRMYSFEEGQQLLAQAKVRGQHYLSSLISEGKLVPPKKIAEFWGISNQALGNRKRAGDVLGLLVNNRLWYPIELENFPTRDSAEYTCMKIKTLSPIEQYLVLTNSHAALGNRTIAQALQEKRVRDVEALMDSILASA